MRQQLATREHFRRGNAILTLIVARHPFAGRVELPPAATLSIPQNVPDTVAKHLNGSASIRVIGVWLDGWGRLADVA
jgi:hypothetical protein